MQGLRSFTQRGGVSVNCEDFDIGDASGFNLKIDANRLAASNAELVKKIADNCDRFGRRPATPAEAREILGLRKAA